jgi:hypothetical protein
MGLGGCIADSVKSASEIPPPSPIDRVQEETVQAPSGTGQEPGPNEPTSGEIQERGIPIKPLSGAIRKAEGFVGATDNITKVGRAVQVRTKSLTTLVVVAPGVAVTQPVTISIALGGYGPTRQTQTYVASSGNHFLYTDTEGDGKPRRAFADITLSEPKPGGGIYTSTIPGSVMLDPLYDITVSPLSVKLIDDCDAYGDSDLYVDWYSPDDQYHHISFKTRARNAATTINAFAWARTEVGALANLHLPTYFITELDLGESIDPKYKGPGPSNLNLLPGTTKDFSAKVNVLTRQKQCRANVQYTITYKLRWYPFL